MRLRTFTVVINGLNLDLVRHIGGRSGHNELGDVGHVLGGPVLVHVLLSPLDLVLQAGTVGLKSCQLLCEPDDYFIPFKDTRQQPWIGWLPARQQTNT